MKKYLTFILGLMIIISQNSGGETIKINFFSKQESVNIHYSDGINGWTKAPGVPMQKSSENWWSRSIQADELQFSFYDSTGRWHDLGGTMGRYPKDPPESFRTASQEIWVKNNILYDYNPEKQRPKNEVVALTLNLHTYQEKNQDEKFNIIVDAIYNLDADVVFFQEAAQHVKAEVLFQEHGVPIRQDNMIKIIKDLLGSIYNKTYYSYWDWGHYGWYVWEEGIGILSKHPFIEVESKYISKANSVDTIYSRKAAYAKIDIPQIGKINLFSCHMSWWNSGFQHEFDNLEEWINEKKESDVAVATLVAGDFNVEAGTSGYKYITKGQKFIDSYYYTNPRGFNDATVGGKIAGWGNSSNSGKRIDYIFIEKESSLVPALGQRIFTERSYGRVSDHNGQYVRFKVSN